MGKAGTEPLAWLPRTVAFTFLGVLGFLAVLVLDNRQEVASIKSNRFTSKDGDDLRKEIVANIPPQWLVDRLNRMENKLDRITEEVQNHEH